MALANVPQEVPSDAGSQVLPPDIAYRIHPWYDAYMAALFEADRKQIAEKVRLAERLMVRRQREILRESPTVPERKALDKAFHALRALELCLKL